VAAPRRGRRWRAAGGQVDELRVTMPVSIHKADDPIGGNLITLMRFKVPVSIADPASGFARLTSAASR